MFIFFLKSFICFSLIKYLFQIEYKIMDKIFKIEKIKRDNSNIKLDNKLFNELNSNIQFNNNELYFPFSSFSSNLFDYNFEQEFHDDL